MNRFLATILAGLLAAQPVVAGQFVVELGSPLEPPPAVLMSDHGVSIDETLSAGADSYAVFSASNAETLQEFLNAAEIRPDKISEVLFVNSPEVGGGDPAGSNPRPGHQVYVIERPIPGVGFFGLEKKQAISENSNKAIETLGDIIEWDHSYLTNEGTYCVYRADSPETLREHGALAGAPIGRITEVAQQLH
jgi:hypothetical protein